MPLPSRFDWPLIGAILLVILILLVGVYQLDRPTYPGELGQRIFDSVSKLAWQRWLGHQTMLINENRLSPIEPKAREFLEREMEKYFFGEGSERPPGFVEE